jgi:hypothetical protein
MQVKFSIFFHRGSLNVIGDKFRFVRSKLKSRLIYKLSIFSFSCLRRSVLIEHIANAWGDLLVLLIVFCKIDKLTLLSIKLINTLIKINYSLSTFRRCQDSRERGKGDWHWLYKKTFRYRLPVITTSTTKFKIPINQDTKFIKKISFNFKIFISFQTGFHTYSGLKILLKCHFHVLGQT